MSDSSYQFRLSCGYKAVHSLLFFPSSFFSFLTPLLCVFQYFILVSFSGSSSCSYFHCHYTVEIIMHTYRTIIIWEESVTICCSFEAHTTCYYSYRGVSHLPYVPFGLVLKLCTEGLHNMYAEGQWGNFLYSFCTMGLVFLFCLS